MQSTYETGILILQISEAQRNNSPCPICPIFSVEAKEMLLLPYRQCEMGGSERIKVAQIAQSILCKLRKTTNKLRKLQNLTQTAQTAQTTKTAKNCANCVNKLKLHKLQKKCANCTKCANACADRERYLRDDAVSDFPAMAWGSARSFACGRGCEAVSHGMP